MIDPISVSDSKVLVPTFLSGSGGMNERIRRFNWADTPLGGVEHWKQSLRSALGISLNSNFPIAIYWGEQLILLYNDAWSPIPGNKHPWALGRPAKEVWPEIWDEIEPQFAKAFSGEAGGSKNALLPMQRHGYTEECYFDFTFTPVYGEDGTVDGIFNAVIETTYQLIHERRTSFLQYLSLEISSCSTSKELFKKLNEVLSAKQADISFCYTYILTESNESVLVASTSTERIIRDLPFKEVTQVGSSIFISNLPDYFDHVPESFWPESPAEAVLVPLKATNGNITGFIFAGLSARRRADREYQVFFDNIGSQVSIVLNIIQSLEEERKRVESLAEIDRAKTIFFSNISHEFRTPLTLILGPLEELLTSSRDDRQLENLSLAYRNTLRLQKLVNSLLDFSRIEAGRMLGNFTAVDICSLTTDLASSFRSAIEKAGMKLIIQCETMSRPVYLDTEMYEKIVLNLISNAFKYTFAGTITVSVKQENQSVLLSVSDTGIGISQKEMQKIFDRFYRVQNNKGRSMDGSGIGLSLVKELVRIHQGEINVYSEVNKGSSFQVRIPMGNDNPLTQIPAIESLNSRHVKSYTEEALRWTDQSRSWALQPASEKVTVLVADDNSDMRDYIQHQLSPQYQVLLANDGEEAFERASEYHPDIILTDIMMPRLDGYGLLLKLRADPGTKNIPVIFLSARAGEEAKVEGLDAGADDYLVKPFSSKELKARLSALMKINTARKKLEENEAALRLAKDQLELTFQHVPAAIYLFDKDGKVLFLNTQARIFAEIDPQDENIRELNIKWFHKKTSELFEIFDETGQPFSMDNTPAQISLRTGKGAQQVLHFINKSAGWQRWVLASTSPLLDEQGNIMMILATSTDITSQKQAEEKIKESEQHFRSLTMALPQLVWVTDARGRQEFVTERWKEYTGMDPLDSSTWAEMIHPDDTQAIAEAWNYSLQSGNTYKAEARLRGKDGTYRWFHVQGEPIRNENKEIIKWVGAFTDIHEQKQGEDLLRQSEEKLEFLVEKRTEELQRSNEDLQQFAHVASHDMKEPIRKIKIFSELLTDEFQEGISDQAKVYLSKIQKASDRMLTMMDSVLRYAGMDGYLQGIEIIDLNDILLSVETDLEIVIQKKKAMVRRDHLPKIQGYPVLIYQLFYNLISNALKFSRTDIRPLIQIRYIMEKRENRIFARIAIKDNGIGFEPENATLIFNSFTRLNTKEDYEGTGLGLSLCKKIVSRHLGFLSAVGKPNSGAEFVVLLPMDPEKF